MKTKLCNNEKYHAFLLIFTLWNTVFIFFFFLQMRSPHFTVCFSLKKQKTEIKKIWTQKFARNARLLFFSFCFF